MKKYQMRKKLLVITFLFCMIFQAYSEAPELRNVMPNSWQKVTRLTTEEKQAFLQENELIMQEIAREIEDDMYRDDYIAGGFHYSIYRQSVGDEVFYRVLCTENSTPDFMSPAISFFQYLIYKNKILFDYHLRYNERSLTQDDTFGVFEGIDIIEESGNVKGILRYGVSVRLRGGSTKTWSGILRKGQPYARNTAQYYLMSEVNKMIRGERYSAIQIEASDCLVDPNIPLRYSLQNAFDGDPATSYVENTEDDLMNVQVYLNPSIIQRFAIINGYAQNMTLYKNNNRIKTIGVNNRVTIHDDSLYYQIFDWQYQSLSVTDIYEGNRYDDTCLAEFNVFTINHGWLFGDIENE